METSDDVYRRYALQFARDYGEKIAAAIKEIMESAEPPKQVTIAEMVEHLKSEFRSNESSETTLRVIALLKRVGEFKKNWTTNYAEAQFQTGWYAAKDFVDGLP